MNVSDLGEDVKQYKLKLIYIILFFVIIGLVIYSQVITAKLFFDDEYYIVRNLYVHDFNYAGKIFTSGATNGAGFITTYYRPMQFLSYLIIYSMFKTNPMPYHLFSIFLHIGISILIYLILNHLNYSTTVSIFSSLLFLVHPLSTQAVSYVSGSRRNWFVFCNVFVVYLYSRGLFL